MSAISRRGFLQATAIAGLAAVAGETCLANATPGRSRAYAAEGEETKIIKTCCAGCVGRCGVLAHVRNGRVVKLEGDPDHVYSRGDMCAKGLSFIQALYNPNRIKYPMRRAGERGENKWERISWDEALQEIGQQMMEINDKYGGESLLVGHGGGGHTYYVNVANRFAHVFGGFVFEPGGLQCLQPRQTTQRLMWGSNNIDFVGYEGMCTEYFKGEETKCLVLWGINPAASNIASAERAVSEMRANGTKTVAIDPRFTPDASKADVWLPVRPGSDLALMLCWIKYIIDHDLWDKEAVYKWSNLPFLVNLETKLTLKPEEAGLEGDETTYVVWDKKTGYAQPLPFYPFNEDLDIDLTGGPYVVNGIECKPAFQLLKERVNEWTLEKTAQTCWLDADKIEEAIRLYTDNAPSDLVVGMACDHTVHSAQAGMAQFILQTIMGNFCRPGNFMQQFDGDHPYWSDPGMLQHFMPEEQYVKRFGAIEYKAANNKEWTHNSLLLEAMISGEPYRPHIIIERSGNKLLNMPNAERWAEAFEKTDLIVHHYMYPTSFSMYADYLLPAPEWLESTWTVGLEHRVYVRQPATHLWEGVEEPMLFSLLAKTLADMGHQKFIDSFDPEKCKPGEDNVPANFAKSLGAGGQIPWWNSMEDMFDKVFASNEADMTFSELKETIERDGWYQAVTDEEYQQFGVYKQIDPETNAPNGFGTPSGKLEMYAEQVTIMGRTGAPYSLYELPPAPVDYDPLPYYREPSESPLNPEFADFPLVLTGGHVPVYTHCTLRNVPWLRERFPVPNLSINPADAEKFAVADGDWVWVESKRGKTQGLAKVTAEVNPGVVHMERFWFPEKLGTDTHGYKEMNVNMLTDDQCQFNDIIGSCTYRGFQVKVYKADSAPAGIYLEPQEFESWLPDYEGAEVTDAQDAIKGVFNV